jgi:hypothetical protein
VRLNAKAWLVLLAVVLTALPAFALAQTRYIEFVAFDDFPTTSVLSTGDLPKSDKLAPLSSEGLYLIMDRARALHREAVRQHQEVTKAISEGADGIDRFDETTGFGGGPAPIIRVKEPDGRKVTRVRWRREGRPDLRARLDAEGKVCELSYSLDGAAVDARRRFVYLNDHDTCRVMAIMAQSPDGFMRFWMFRPNQKLMGFARCDSGMSLEGPFVEWGEDGSIRRAMTISNAGYYFETPPPD